MVNINAQEYLNEKYPLNGLCERDNDLENKGKSRQEITKLDIRKGKVGNGFFSQNKNLIGSLKLEGFDNLRKLIISSHQIINLDVSNSSNLEELDCQGNELTNLNVTNCSRLKKINCSNNNLGELDLSTCPKLEEVNINNCSNLNSETIISNLDYDTDNSKLIKSGLPAKSSPQIRKVVKNDIRNILIVGITGNGKSALANALSGSGTNEFEEKDSSTSVTKSFKESGVFQWEGKSYRLIDNIGFGDANISESDILFEIGKGIHSAKEGISQILFVFKGRLSPEHITAFNTFKDFINETGITKFTTLVRTNFKDFRSQEKCQEDKQTLLSQSKDISEIVNSCNNIIYIDNPSTIIEEDSEDSEDEREEKKKEASRNEKKRKESRERVLNHLVENCLEIYKLKEWDSIVSMVNRYNEKKAQIEQSNSLTKEKELKQAKNEVAKEINQGIKVSVGAEVPGIGGFTSAVEYTRQKINW